MSGLSQMDVAIRGEILQERNAAFADLLSPLRPLHERTLLEIGAANGWNVPHLIEMGFRPQHLVINDLAVTLIADARKWLPPSVRIVPGDAASLSTDTSFDVVLASTLFTSILNDSHRRRVAETAWRLVKPGGGVLLHDFSWNNPWNPRVRKLTLAEVRSLFPEASYRVRRITLAPPIARHVSLPVYRLLHRCRWLRTHFVCWLGKAASIGALPAASDDVRSG